MNKLRVILAGAALLLTFVAGGQNTRTQETKKAKLEKEIAQIDAQLKANASKTSTAQSDLVLIRTQGERCAVNALSTPSVNAPAI